MKFNFHLLINFTDTVNSGLTELINLSIKRIEYEEQNKLLIENQPPNNEDIEPLVVIFVNLQY